METPKTSASRLHRSISGRDSPLSEPGIVGYHAKAKTLYDSLRQRQKDYPQRLADGETLEALAEETWQLLCDNA